MESISQYLLACVEFHPQFYLNADGKPRGPFQWDSYVPESFDHRQQMLLEMERIVANDATVSMVDLSPQWEQQRFTLLVPCKTGKYFWAKAGFVASLPEFFETLTRPYLDQSREEGLKYDSGTMHWAYLHQQLIASKRFKGR